MIVAVQVIEKRSESDDLSSPKVRRRRSFACDVGKRRMRRSCVIIPDPPPPPPTESSLKVLVADNLGFDGEYFFPNQTPNYNMTRYESSCLYWDEEKQTWKGQGCRVSLFLTYLKCLQTKTGFLVILVVEKDSLKRSWIPGTNYSF